MTELEQENRRYYQRALPAWDHIACFACIGQEIIGCGGICLYQEMPSLDNPQGGCAYLCGIGGSVHFGKARGEGEPEK